MQEAWVRSLVRELRSHMLHGAAKKKKKSLIISHTIAPFTGFQPQDKRATQNIQP